MAENAHGGNDILSATAGISYLYGDALRMRTNVEGGNDTLTLSQSADGLAFGDAEVMFDHSRGGNDVFYGRGTLVRDASALVGSAQGGDDHIAVIGTAVG